MTITRRSLRVPALVGLALLLSGCALPPAVTVLSFAADFASVGQTGKTITDHGLSFMAQKDCALMRIFSKTPICQEIPDENTPAGALAALAPLPDRNVSVVPGDPMTLPPGFAYLDGSLGLAVASRGPRADEALPAHAFASVRDMLDGDHVGPDEPAPLSDARYLVAGMPAMALATQAADAAN